MKNVLSSAAGLAVVIVAGLFLFAQAGIIDIKMPWDNPNIHSAETTIKMPAEPTIVEIEAISLDCRARIHTVVPIEGKREHKALGQVYRTDTLTMRAVGDIDTCVASDEVEVINRDNETVRVIIPADAIRFERPRVDAIATADSVHFDKGFVGKLADALPWVSDDSDLTPAGYAYAQAVLGSSACNELAYEMTRDAIIESYEEALRAHGLDGAELDVDIVGDPIFDANTQPDEVDQFSFSVDEDATTCTVADDAEIGATESEIA